jgi:hypothetical protein
MKRGFGSGIWGRLAVLLRCLTLRRRTGAVLGLWLQQCTSSYIRCELRLATRQLVACGA